MRLSSVVFACLVAVGVVACGDPPPPEAPPAVPPPAPTPAPTPVTSATAPAKPEAPAKTLAEKMEDTTKGLVEAWNAHEADKIVAAYADGAVMKIVGMPEMTGKDAIKAAVMENFKAFPDFKVALTRVVMKGNTAVIEWVITGTSKGDSEMMHLKASNRPMGLRGVDIAVFDDAGLVKEGRRYFDMPTQMMQLDAKAKAGTFRPVETLPTGAPVMHASKGTPEEQKALDLVNAMYKAMDAKKLDDAFANVAPDATMEDYTQPKAIKGVKEGKAFMGMVMKAIPDMKQDVLFQVAAGDLVVTEGHMHGTMKGAFGPMKATNKPVGMHMVDIMQVKDGKMVAGWSYGNSMEMMPPPPAPKAAAPAKPAAAPAAPAKPAPKKK